MRKRNILLTLKLFCSLNVSGQPIPSPKTEPDTAAIRLQRDLNKLSREFELDRLATEKKLSSAAENSDRQFQHLGYQIDTATYTLGIFTIVLTIVSLALGVHINKIWAKIERARSEALDANQRTENIYKLIKKDIGELYLDIKREETVDILNRLQKVPEDIANLHSILLSRDLISDDFERLKIAYIKLKSRNIPASSRHKNSYLVALAQHFTEKCIADPILRPDYLKSFHHILSSCFTHEFQIVLPTTIKVVLGDEDKDRDSKWNEIFLQFSLSGYAKKTSAFSLIVECLNLIKPSIEFYRVTEENHSFLKITKLKFLSAIIEQDRANGRTGDVTELQNERTRLNAECEKIEALDASLDEATFKSELEGHDA